MAEKLKILFLDDRSKRIHAALEKYAEHDLTIVTTVKECIEKISNEAWDLVSLDHDLNYESFVDPNRSDCGMEVVRFLCEKEKFLLNSVKYPLQRGIMRPSKIIIHTSNAVAATEMIHHLQKSSYNVFYERFEYG